MQRRGDVSVLGGAGCHLTDDVPANRVHLVGVAGYGVRQLVPLLRERGATITGSDKSDSPILQRFRHAGVECWVGHSDRNVSPGTDLVVISAAVSESNPEVRAAHEKRIRVLKYAQCLGYLMGEKRGIAVAGTHGKTTTSAMVSWILFSTGRDPTFVIGGEHPDLGGGSRCGDGPHFVAEACEFDRSFLNLRPRAAVVTNVEAEHLDYFRNFREIQTAFEEFVGLLPEDGLLVYNSDDPGSQFLADAGPAGAVTFSLREGWGDWTAHDITRTAEGSRFTVLAPDGRQVQFRLRIPGEFNVRNALASAVVSTWAGVPLEEIAEALAHFRSVRRRFDILCREPYTVIDDYAHHPTEVDAVVRAAREKYPGRELVCVMQPHQFSRLRIFKDRFADALLPAQRVIVAPVHQARDREEDIRAVTAADLVEAIRRRGGLAFEGGDFHTIKEHLRSTVRDGSIVLFLGAGSVTELAQEFAFEAELTAAPEEEPVGA